MVSAQRQRHRLLLSLSRAPLSIKAMLSSSYRRRSSSIEAGNIVASAKQTPPMTTSHLRNISSAAKASGPSANTRASISSSNGTGTSRAVAFSRASIGPLT